MSNSGAQAAPDVDPDLLVTHLEYAAWAAQKTLAMADKLPSAALTQPIKSSFPTILATMQHVYGWDKYYFIHLQGGSIEREAVEAPETYDELKHEWANLHSEMIGWAKENLASQKDAVLRGWGVWPSWMVVMQIANHATHHYGQLITLFHQLGYAPEPADWTDLIIHYLRRYPQDNQTDLVKPFLE